MPETDTIRRQDTEIEPLFTALRRIGRALDQGSRSLLARHGLTAPQVLLLRHLANHPDLAVGELATGVGLGQATVTDILGRLELRGLVTRDRSPEDRRRSVLRLTVTAQSMLSLVPSQFPEAFNARFMALDPEARSELVVAVQRLAALMEG